MQQLVSEFATKQQKAKLVDVHSGDSVRVHQRIREGSKTRTQVFEGLVIRVDRRRSLTARITVRRLASGVGVEKSFLLHSPLVEKVEVIKRSRVRRNYLSYMRARSGKSARLAGVDFDQASVNAPNIEQQRAEATAGQTGDNQPVEESAASDAKAPAEPAPAKSAKAEDKPSTSQPEAAETVAPAAEGSDDDNKVKDKKAKAEAFRQAHEK